MKVLPHEEIASMIDAGDLYLGTAAAKKLLGSAGAVVVTVGMVLAMFGSMNGLILAQPRVVGYRHGQGGPLLQELYQAE